MSRIDDLILEACPDGVRWVPMGEAFTMRAGTHLAASLIQSEESGDNVIPVYGGNGLRGYGSSSTHIGEFLLIGRQGARCGNVHRVSGTFYATEHAVVTQVSDSVDTNFAFHLLTAMDLNQYKSSGAQPGLAVSNLASVRVPIPPLVVQHEIVAILDRFTELEAELEAVLEAELEARRRQYEYYRDELLEFGTEDLTRVPMSEVGEFIRGRRFTKDDIVPDGIGTIHYGEIYTHYGTSALEPLSRVRPELAPNLRFAHPGDVVVAAVGETVEDVGKAVAWLGYEDVAAHDDCFIFRSPLNPKFVAYYFQTSALNAEKAKYVARAKVKRLSGESLGRLTIPVPPLDEQERVVSILDKFDALVNDLSTALPAELRARRQQYEYYRDRLLTFQEAA